MRLVHRYSLLPFMTPRQFFYPRVVLEFYHTMTSRGVSNQMQLHFSIDGRHGILCASDITTTLGLLVVLANSVDYQQWPHPSPREMVRSLSLSRYNSRVYPCSEAASSAYSPHRPRTSVQSVPASALFAVQRSYSRGSVSVI